jgi:hypothetical protein
MAVLGACIFKNRTPGAKSYNAQMNANLTPWKAAPIRRVRGAGVGLCIRPIAFGNALGNAIGGSITTQTDAEKIANATNQYDAETARLQGYENAAAASEQANLTAGTAGYRGGYDPADLARANYPRSAQFFETPTDRNGAPIQGVGGLSDDSSSIYVPGPYRRETLDNGTRVSYFSEGESFADIPNDNDLNFPNLPGKTLTRTYPLDDVTRGAYNNTVGANYGGEIDSPERQENLARITRALYGTDENLQTSPSVARPLGVADLGSFSLNQPDDLSFGIGQDGGLPRGNSVFNFFNDQRGTAGFSAVSGYDALQRVGYKAATQLSRSQYLDKLTSISPATTAEVDALARGAYDARQSLRTATQQTLSPSGKVISRLIEQTSTFEKKLAERFTKAAKAGQVITQNEALKRVIIASGESNKYVSGFNSFSRFAGPLGATVGIGLSGYAIANAAPGQTGRVTAEEAGALVGGIAFGTAATYGAGILIGAAGLTFAPAILAVGIVAGIGGAYYGSNLGREAGTYYYNLLR